MKYSHFGVAAACICAVTSVVSAAPVSRFRRPTGGSGYGTTMANPGPTAAAAKTGSTPKPRVESYTTFNSDTPSTSQFLHLDNHKPLFEGDEELHGLVSKASSLAEAPLYSFPKPGATKPFSPAEIESRRRRQGYSYTTVRSDETDPFARFSLPSHIAPLSEDDTHRYRLDLKPSSNELHKQYIESPANFRPEETKPFKIGKENEAARPTSSSAKTSFSRWLARPSKAESKQEASTSSSSPKSSFPQSPSSLKTESGDDSSSSSNRLAKLSSRIKAKREKPGKIVPFPPDLQPSYSPRFNKFSNYEDKPLPSIPAEEPDLGAEGASGSRFRKAVSSSRKFFSTAWKKKFGKAKDKDNGLSEDELKLIGDTNPNNAYRRKEIFQGRRDPAPENRLRYRTG